MKKPLKILRENWVLILIILGGLFLRAYRPLELFGYSHDQDLAGWFIRDVIINHHIRLIGQETSSHGVFIGPLFYYLQIPFYLIANMDPAGAPLLPIILGVFSVFSFYFVFSKMFDKRVGLIASFIYSFSVLIVFTDREVVPTMPAMLWGVWFLYSLFTLFKGQQKSYLLIGLLFGIVWDINLALIILAPLVVLTQIFSKKRIDFKLLLAGVGVFILLMLPFFGFEIRHEFQQTRAVISSLTTQKDYVPGTSKGLPKLDRVMQLVDKNSNNMFWDSVLPIPSNLMFCILVVAFVFLAVKGIISKELFVLMLLWQVLYIGFFTSNPLNTSEYYLNGMNIVWIGVFASGIGLLIKSGKLKYLGYLVLAAFLGLNLYSFFTRNINRSGYVERKAITAYIKSDAMAHGYPCVSVSYITSPGNNLGYRYFFALENLHVNQPKSGSPVYTIVFPLSGVDRVDKSFGALGLVLPDYQRYTKSGIEVSCSGQNANLTDPLFGFTQ